MTYLCMWISIVFKFTFKSFDSDSFQFIFIVLPCPTDSVYTTLTITWVEFSITKTHILYPHHPNKLNRSHLARQMDIYWPPKTTLKVLITPEWRGSWKEPTMTASIVEVIIISSEPYLYIMLGVWEWVSQSHLFSVGQWSHGKLWLGQWCFGVRRHSISCTETLLAVMRKCPNRAPLDNIGKCYTIFGNAWQY